MRFHVGNACEMVRDAEILGEFDCVIMANLLCRSSKPRACLDGVNEVVSRISGHVFIFTPWSWLDEYTPDAEERLDEFSLVDEMEERGFCLSGRGKSRVSFASTRARHSTSFRRRTGLKEYDNVSMD